MPGFGLAGDYDHGEIRMRFAKQRESVAVFGRVAGNEYRATGRAAAQIGDIESPADLIGFVQQHARELIVQIVRQAEKSDTQHKKKLQTCEFSARSGE